MKTKICSRCGMNYLENENFCPNCGEKNNGTQKKKGKVISFFSKYKKKLHSIMCSIILGLSTITLFLVMSRDNSGPKEFETSNVGFSGVCIEKYIGDGGIVVIPSEINILGIPHKVVAFGPESFSNGNAQYTIYFDGTIEDWVTMEFIGKHANPMYYANEIYFLDENGVHSYNGKHYSKPYSLVIDKDINRFSNDAFFDLYDLKEVYYNGTLEDWCEINFENFQSNPMTYAERIYILDEGGTKSHKGLSYNLFPNEINIPTHITKINPYTFYGFEQIEKVIVGEHVEEIGNSAFMFCSNLESITLPFVGQRADGNGYRNFGYIFAFENYTDGHGTPSSLKDVIITGGTSIEPNAFSSAYGIENIVIPGSISKFGSHAFWGCTTIKNIYYQGRMSDWCEITFDDEYSTPMFFGNNFYLLDSNGSVEFYGNKYTEITEITIDGNANSINSYSFLGWTNLEKVTIEEGVKRINAMAFYGCDKLTDIIIPYSVTYIGANAFSSCNSLININITKNIEESIGAFEGLVSLDNVYYDGTIEDWLNENYEYLNASPCSSGANLYFLDEKGEYTYGNKKYNLPSEIIIPHDINEIKDLAFYGVENIKKIVFHDNITKIGDVAFGKTSLEYIEIPGSVIEMGQQTFWECTSLKEVVFNEGLKEIPNHCFVGCSSLEKVIIPDSLIKINEVAFEKCTSLKELDIKNVETIKYATFMDCVSLKYIYSNLSAEDFQYVLSADLPYYLEGAKIYLLDENGDVVYNGKTYSEYILK